MASVLTLGHFSVVELLLLKHGFFRNRMIEWRRYEACKLLEEREARGELPIDINFVPPDLIESMVPPPGDWEEEWLRTQPSVKSKYLRHYWVEASSY